ncbi:tryptophan 2,3-dioxygenase-like [Amphiura filiformis]|uniref:tryptophan 2,3-dioxygenase-like n=1 Tax=Amphiura filiformis TaxID=82378 RepID=UPI003B20FCC7
MSCPFSGAALNGMFPTPNTNGNNSSTKDKNKPEKLTYGNYLHLDQVLGSNVMQSELHGDPIHDEHLFITVHQVYELWFKQILYEMDSVREMLSSIPVDESHMLLINTRMGRINMIMKLLLEQVHVVETMTPFDFSAFRCYLGGSSGFESYQFRVLENKLGIVPSWRTSYAQKSYTHVHHGPYLEDIKQAEKEPSMLNLVERWLERAPGLEEDGFNFWARFSDSVERMLEDKSDEVKNIENEAEKEIAKAEYETLKETFDSILDVSIHDKLRTRGERRLSHKALQGALLISFYRNEVRFHQPYQFLSLLMDLDSLLMKWRSNHMLMAQRMIGSKAGTGGSSGYQYLRSTVSDRYKVFVDLFNLCTFHLPPAYIPQLPRRVKRMLSIPNSPQMPTVDMERLSLAFKKRMEEDSHKELSVQEENSA